MHRTPFVLEYTVYTKSKQKGLIFRKHSTDEIVSPCPSIMEEKNTVNNTLKIVFQFSDPQSRHFMIQLYFRVFPNDVEVSQAI